MSCLNSNACYNSLTGQLSLDSINPDLNHINWEAAGAETVRHLSELIKLDTTNPPGNETIAAEYLAGVLRAEGIEPVVLEYALGRGNLVARLKGDGSAAPLLLYGHTDVVPAEPEYWTHGPFSGEVADGYVWGRGAVDMKGMVAMSLMVMLLLKRSSAALKRDVIFAATADEEVAGKGMRFLVENHPDLIRAEYGLSEIGGFNMQVGGKQVYPIQVAEKGAVWVKVRAMGKPGHAAIPHSENAVLYLASALQRLGQRGLPYHLTEPAATFIDGLASALGGLRGRLLRQLKNPLLAPRLLRRMTDRSLARMLSALLHNTATPTALSAGKKTNVIPSVAEATIDCRVLSGFSSKAVLAELEDALGAGFEYEVLLESPPVSFNHQTALFETIRETVRRHDPHGSVVPCMLTAATDAKYTAPLGVLTYGFSPLRFSRGENFLELLHAHDERAPVEGLAWGLRVLFETVANFTA